MKHTHGAARFFAAAVTAALLTALFPPAQAAGDSTSGRTPPNGIEAPHSPEQAPGVADDDRCCVACSMAAIAVSATLPGPVPALDPVAARPVLPPVPTQAGPPPTPPPKA